MTVREKMKKFREDHLLSLKDMANICGTSSDILGMVENGDVTHPLIVEKFRKHYNLTELEAEQLMPRNRRPHDPEYDPEMYVHAADRNMRIVKSDKTKPNHNYDYEYSTSKGISKIICNKSKHGYNT